MSMLFCSILPQYTSSLELSKEGTSPCIHGIRLGRIARTPKVQRIDSWRTSSERRIRVLSGFSALATWFTYFVSGRLLVICRNLIALRGVEGISSRGGERAPRIMGETGLTSANDFGVAGFDAAGEGGPQTIRFRRG